MKPTTEVIKGNGTTIRTSIIIHRSRQEVWRAVSHPGNIAAFHPLIKHSEAIDGQATGDGAERVCQLVPMGEMVEQATDWKEGFGYTMTVAGGKMMPPTHVMRGELRLMDHGEACKVSFDLHYRLKGGVVGKLMDALMIRPQFVKAPPQYVIGLKHFVENGQKISKSQLRTYGF